MNGPPTKPSQDSDLSQSPIDNSPDRSRNDRCPSMNDDSTLNLESQESGSRGSGSTFTGLSDIVGLAPANPEFDPFLGSDVGGVTIVRLIAEGGMGRVYEGKQEKPSRAVAVKVMRPGLALPSLLKRFEYEAEVLGRLQHPGIAHIYSVGVHRLGSAAVPYFVMEYIANARTLTKYADDLDLPTRRRLELFRGVCDAVAHGHQKGVIHRDLKPSNILVDATGQPKVIDFGVARATDSDMALTTIQTDVGQLIGTLQYMSPEQFGGDPNDVDIRSDVYALGVVLYELLAGKPPYDVKKKAIHEVIRIVKEEEPTPLSSFSRALRGDVAVIAGKCLAKEPIRRYASASALSDDVGRYLSGEPIQAKPQGFVDGVLRLARKHRGAAAATAGVFTALVGAVIGIAAFAIRAERSRADAEAARREADDQRAVATQATEKANKARDNAVTSRAAAEGLVKFMTVNLREKLLPIGRLDLMEEVLRKLEVYQGERERLEESGQEQATSADLTNRFAFWANMGDLAMAAGDIAAARRHYEKAHAIIAALATQDPRNTAWSKDLAVCHGKLGRAALATGDLGAARGHSEKAVVILERLVSQDPRNAECRRELAIIHNGLGSLAEASGDPAAARMHYEKFREIMEILVAQDPRDARWQRDLAASHNNLGALVSAMGDGTAARGHHEKAVSIMEDLTAHDPRNTGWQRDLSASLNNLGDLASDTGDRAAARRHYEKACTIRQKLAAQDPRNADWRWELSVSHGKLGDLASATGDVAAARECYGKAASIQETLVAQDPRNSDWQRELSVSHGKLGDLARAAGDHAAARAHGEKAFAILKKLVAQNPRNTMWQMDLSVSHGRLGELAHATGDIEAAREHYEQGLVIMETLVARHSRHAEWQRELAVSHSKLGRLAQATGDLDTARRHYEKAVAVLEFLVARNPRNRRWQWDLVVLYHRTGNVAQANESAADARDWYLKAMELADEGFARSMDPEIARFRMRILRSLAQCHHELGESDAAAVCEQRIADLGAESRGDAPQPPTQASRHGSDGTAPDGRTALPALHGD